MQILVNGKAVETAAVDLRALLEEMGVGTERVAVERNQALVPRRLWQETRLEPGDRIEVVQFVGGG